MEAAGTFLVSEANAMNHMHPLERDTQAMTLDERLTAAAIILRDAIERYDAKVAAESAKSPQNSQCPPFSAHTSHH